MAYRRGSSSSQASTTGNCSSRCHRLPYRQVCTKRICGAKFGPWLTGAEEFWEELANRLRLIFFVPPLLFRRQGRNSLTSRVSRTWFSGEYDLNDLGFPDIRETEYVLRLRDRSHSGCVDFLSFMDNILIRAPGSAPWGHFGLPFAVPWVFRLSVDLMAPFCRQCGGATIWPSRELRWELTA